MCRTHAKERPTHIQTCTIIITFGLGHASNTRGHVLCETHYKCEILT